MPKVVVVAGPNGAGKSTVAPALVRDDFGVHDYVNADAIAAGLSAFAPELAALQAGRILLERVRDLGARRADFAFETTLATRSFAPWLEELSAQGYTIHVVFLWLPSPDVAVARVQTRVALGGHDIPEDVIRRRYGRGVDNLRRLYAPLATTWQVFDASGSPPRLVAHGRGSTTTAVLDARAWSALERP